MARQMLRGIRERAERTWAHLACAAGMVVVVVSHHHHLGRPSGR